MKLVKTRISNLRCYKDEVSVDLEPFTALVGRNDCGKSTIFEALGAFFGEVELESSDASVGGNAEDVRIVCEFDRLEPIVLDADVATTFDAEYLLNSARRLEICKVFDLSSSKPKLKGVFVKALHPSAENLSDLHSLRIAELKRRAEDLGVDLNRVNRSVSTEIRRKIWAGRELALQERLIRIDDPKTKAIWEQIEIQLPVFALFKSDRASTDQDSEAQDPMKAAIKEALKAKESELEGIVAHVQNEVQKIADATIRKLNEMEPSLAGELKPRFTKPNWSTVFKVDLTGEGQIPVNKRGSGVRRLLLLNFFRAKAEQNLLERSGAGVIYAIEEPETSQHPNVQIMLKDAFARLSAEANCQILITTHTPMLARLIPSSGLRFIDGVGSARRTVYSGEEGAYRRCAQSLGVLADHDVKLFIGVEGPNDIAFLKAISKVLIRGGEDVPDLEALEEQSKIVFIPVGGSNLAYWASRLANLHRPEFYVMDRDVQPPAISPKQAKIDELNARGCVAKLTAKREMENYLHPDVIRATCNVELDPIGNFDDVPATVAKKVHEASGSVAAWGDLTHEKREDKISNAKRRLNGEAANRMTPALLTAADPGGEVRAWLAEISRLLAG